MEAQSLKYKNLNTISYWNDIYEFEIKNPWRLYPISFNKISAVVGTEKRVIDIGCGTGILLDILRKNGNETWGIDISHLAIKHVCHRDHYGIVGRVPDVSLKKTIFDFVVATEVLEHIDEEEETIHFMLSLLKPSGTLIGIVPMTITSDDEPTHLRVYTKEALRKLLPAGVFVEEFQETFDCIQWGQITRVDLPLLFFCYKKQS